MRVLVTGSGGFIGCVVVSQLRQRGDDVHTLGRRSTAIVHPLQGSNSHHVVARTDDRDEIEKILRNVAPDAVLHLAGSSVAPSLSELYGVNVVFAATILEAAATLPNPPRILLVGSAAEYGPVSDTEQPVQETHECAPNTAYGVTKLAQTYHGLIAAKSGLPVVIARVFNPVGPGMSASLALGSFVRQIAALGPDGGVLRTGNLNVIRDFIDVRETSRVLIEIATAANVAGEIFNVCTGEGANLSEITQQLISYSLGHVQWEYDADRAGNSQVNRFVGSAAKLRKLGVEVRPPDFGSLLPEMLDFERNRISD